METVFQWSHCGYCLSGEEEGVSSDIGIDEAVCLEVTGERWQYRSDGFGRHLPSEW